MATLLALGVQELHFQYLTRLICRTKMGKWGNRIIDCPTASEANQADTIKFVGTELRHKHNKVRPVCIIPLLQWKIDLIIDAPGPVPRLNLLTRCIFNNKISNTPSLILREFPQKFAKMFWGLYHRQVSISSGDWLASSGNRLLSPSISVFRTKWCPCPILWDRQTNMFYDAIWWHQGRSFKKVYYNMLYPMRMPIWWYVISDGHMMTCLIGCPYDNKSHRIPLWIDVMSDTHTIACVIEYPFGNMCYRMLNQPQQF